MGVGVTIEPARPVGPLHARRPRARLRAGRRARHDGGSCARVVRRRPRRRRPPRHPDRWPHRRSCRRAAELAPVVPGTQRPSRPAVVRRAPVAAAVAYRARCSTPRPPPSSPTSVRPRSSTPQPDCNLDWLVLAAIARIESDHGRGSRRPAHRGPDGLVTPALVGARQDGVADAAGSTTPTPARSTTTAGGTRPSDRSACCPPPGPRSPSTPTATPSATRRTWTTPPWPPACCCAPAGTTWASPPLREALASYHPTKGFVATVLALVARYDEGADGRAAGGADAQWQPSTSPRRATAPTSWRRPAARRGEGAPLRRRLHPDRRRAGPAAGLRHAAGLRAGPDARARADAGPDAGARADPEPTPTHPGARAHPRADPGAGSPVTP